MKPMPTLISLVGEQPMPVLFPARYLKPDTVILVCSDKTTPVAERLSGILSRDCTCTMTTIEPYRLPHTISELRQALPPNEQLIFNLTGGTKPMSFAALLLAGQTEARIVYLESEDKKKLLYSYHFKNNEIHADSDSPEALPTLISADDYLRAHVKHYSIIGYNRDEKSGKISPGGQFEQCVEMVLKSAGMEVLTGVKPASVGEQIEIDHVIRIDNNVGIAEVKLGGEEGQKKGLDQLAMAGGREYLGTYTSKFLIIARSLNRRLHDLARERGISIIEVGYNDRRNELSPQGKHKLISEIERKLKP